MARLVLPRPVGSLGPSIALAFALFMTLVAGTTTAHAESAFRRLNLAYGISLDVPSHWTVLSMETRGNLAAYGEALSEAAGVDTEGAGRREPLLAMNSSPSPHGAMVRVTVSTPAEYSQADVAQVTQADLREIQAEFAEQARKYAATTAFKVTAIETFHTTRVAGLHALAMPYVRTALNAPGTWHVTQYKIPVRGRLVEFTLSYRQSDRLLFQPILDKVKRSMVISQ